MLAISIVHTDLWLGCIGSVAASASLILGDHLVQALSLRRRALSDACSGRSWVALTILARVLAVIGFCAVVLFTDLVVRSLFHVPDLVDEINALCLEDSPGFETRPEHADRTRAGLELRGYAAAGMRPDHVERTAHRSRNVVVWAHRWASQSTPHVDSLQLRCGREARLLRRGLIAALVGSLLLDGALAFCLVLMLYLLRRLDEMEAAAKQLTRERFDV